MRKLSLFVFVVFVAVYLPVFVASMVGGISEAFGHKMFSPEIMGGMMLIVIISQFGWGLVAGTMQNRRGWSMGACKIRSLYNAFMLGVFNFCFASPIVVITGIDRWRYGKFFPTPKEC